MQNQNKVMKSFLSIYTNSRKFSLFQLLQRILKNLLLGSAIIFYYHFQTYWSWVQCKVLIYCLPYVDQTEVASKFAQICLTQPEIPIYIHLHFPARFSYFHRQNFDLNRHSFIKFYGDTKFPPFVHLIDCQTVSSRTRGFSSLGGSKGG